MRNGFWHLTRLNAYNPKHNGSAALCAVQRSEGGALCYVVLIYLEDIKLKAYSEKAKELDEKIRGVSDKLNSLDLNYLYLLRVNENGARVVLRYDIRINDFCVISKKAANDIGLIINNLPDYYEFKKVQSALTRKIQSLFFEYRKTQRDVYKEIKNNLTYPLYKARRENYDCYLASIEWLEKRKECVLIHGDKCLDCGNDYQDIHHLHYESVGCENAKTDIVPLCKPCHAIRHKIDGIYYT